MEPKVYSTGKRILIAIPFFIGGFIFPVLFIVPALIAWAIISEYKDSSLNGAEQKASRHSVTASDKGWENHFYDFCESPAEIAFLKAMLGAYKLSPEKGKLIGNGVILSLQEKIHRYRVDFLVSDWLVVEIDGAEFHSSPEAVANDAARDLYLTGNGYSVLRIPAKTVFSTPDVAVDQVRAAIAVGNKNAKSKSPDGNKKDIKTNFLSQVGRAFDQVADSARIEIEKNKANNALYLRVAAEKKAIESIVKIAESRQRAEEYMAQSDEHKMAFRQAEELLRKRMEDRRLKRGETERRPEKSFLIPPVPDRSPHPCVEIEQAILQDRKYVISGRDDFCEKVRARLNADPHLKSLVKNAMKEYGCEECWSKIS